MVDLGFDGKVAIVTGAGGGLGREHSLLLAGRGALVVVNDVGGALDGTGGDAGPGQQVVDEIKAAGGEAVLDTNSVATPDGGAAIVQTALDAFGRIDIVVNNAGILRDKSFHNMGPDLVDPVLDVHLRGRVLRDAAGVGAHARAGLRPHRGHRVVGRVVRQLRPGQLRRRQDGPRRSRARPRGQEGERYNIKANAIAPMAGTRMTREIFGDELADKLAPGLVSPLVAWLAHEECPVSGHTYSVGGGRVARVFIGEGQGYLKTDAPLTVEDVRDHFDEIESTDDFMLLRNAMDEVDTLAKALG